MKIRELSDFVRIIQKNNLDYLMIEIDLRFNDPGGQTISTRQFVLRRAKLNSLKNIIADIDENYESGVMVVDDLMLQVKSKFLMFSLGSISTKYSVRFNIPLTPRDQDDLKELVDYLLTQ